MTELERAILHIKTRADAWAVKEVTKALQSISERLDKALSQEPQCTEHPCLGTLCRYYKEPCEKCVYSTKDGYCQYDDVTETIPPLELCDDAISRILTRMWNCRGKHTTSIDKVAMEQIIRDELPSVTHKSGKWIIIDDCEQFIAKCSECGRIEDSRMISKYPYCHCGARMESEVNK